MFFLPPEQMPLTPGAARLEGDYLRDSCCYIIKIRRAPRGGRSLHENGYSQGEGGAAGGAAWGEGAGAGEGGSCL